MGARACAMHDRCPGSPAAASPAAAMSSVGSEVYMVYVRKGNECKRGRFAKDLLEKEAQCTLCGQIWKNAAVTK